ncbi:uncharacterized protein L969DRAFT_92408 [Mixia osmundae IAM 14324]|uniref:Uncharacterized protein n=1 Tax=Mixia osmundae (strain CBS 9802 / IAM 14324 / JCM 22182 / KY 12970) TaxID=764103 RepID=G7DXM1_MIXOS|nr:uncharacterized protein L969DRAFT_92408 [Mixia osmundae IAM 14324]KEI41175.1 hypothetical protein L969DRAFT_92408 [Mixia osmundae IAM 14324]GAA95331.1 hypothetical protein E5Q_01988 [Mixia osmundae IAM 14324]
MGQWQSLSSVLGKGPCLIVRGSCYLRPKVAALSRLLMYGWADSQMSCSRTVFDDWRAINSRGFVALCSRLELPVLLFVLAHNNYDLLGKIRKSHHFHSAGIHP